MPAIDFPSAPAVNDEYSFEGRTWLWNGTGWEVKPFPAALQLGTAANPSLYFTGDTNTGIYSPGADQVAISTNGTGRLFVDASGNVVLAPVTARAQFHVYGTGQTTANLTDAGARGGFLRVSDAGSAAGSGGGLIFSNVQGDGANSIGFAAIKGLLTDGSNNTLGDLAFSTRTTNAATALQERMRLTSDGRLGLGTSSPWNNQTIFGQGTAGNLTTARQFGIGASSTYQLAVGYYQTAAANPFAGVLQALDNGSGTRLLLNPSGGNVGIGTTSPGSLLNVRGDANQITVETNDIATYGRLDIGHFTNGGFIGTYAGSNSASDLLRFGTGDSERARIDSSGRLLVGTSTARANYFNATVAPQLQVEGGASGEPIVSVVRNANDVFASHLLLSKTRGTGNVIVADGDTIGNVGFQGNDGSEFVIAATIAAQVDGTPGTNDMPGRLVFSTTADGAATPTERLRITSAGVLQVADAGNITVGTTTGTKIGTATTEKLGFFNKTPVVQPAAVADATDAASAITQLNALLARMRDLGLIAT